MPEGGAALPARGGGGHPDGLLHAHGSGSSLPAWQLGAAACCARTAAAAACLPARGGGAHPGCLLACQGRRRANQGGSSAATQERRQCLPWQWWWRRLPVKARLLNPCTSEEG